ncbi:PLDc N-terminal domain-containing protein [Microbacterium sp. CFBP9034]|uniref:PLDc N-terminal domain-containing protein n=1 Tax=Microbacterium sp. CFBP9034 TaxID=3096540 RepID=UPI002A6A6369|nr:PLDc N-terminal domain-containing protein [Microbacterium sp. CFBP9034]MDY0908756.1 PLDc N-terminal domain-containing protein [Microbacterium sp. CFBP9034]
MPRVLLILALVATAFWVFTIVDCAVQPADRHRGVSKPVWILIVVLLPVLGGLLWLAVGRTRRSVIAARRAPDDDPEFLGSLGTITDQDERIRRLEEELAQLDAEDDDPRWTPDTLGAAPAPGTPTAAAPDSPADPPVRPTEPPVRPADDDERGQRGAVS